MSQVPGISAAAADARALLAEVAASAERKNQPRILLVLSALLVLASLVWVGVAWWSSADAEAEALREQSLTLQIQQGIAAYQEEQQSQEEALGKEALKPNPTMQFVIERLAREAGLGTISITVGKDGRLQAKNLVRKTYSYTINPPQEAALLLKWIDKVQQEDLGVELSSIEGLEPAPRAVEDKPRWKGRILFSRLERKIN